MQYGDYKKLDAKGESTMAASNSRTPFLDVQSFVLEESEAPVSERLLVPVRSPFVSLYELEDGERLYEDPASETYASLVNALYDEEFDEALFELYAEARGIHDEHISSGGSHQESERILNQHFSRLVQESEAAVDAMANFWNASGETARSDHEADSFLESYSPSGPLEPAFEEFWGKLVKKIGSAVKKVGATAWSAAKNLALGPVLRRIKGLIRPLLNKVLSKAIGKLPVVLQPVARRLAGRLGIFYPESNAAPSDPAATDNPEGSGVAPEAPGSPVQDTSGQDGTEIQQEFNEQLAQALLADDEVELELEVARVRAAASSPVAPVFADLDAARERFTNELENLRDGEDPQPHIQNFVMAILPALRVGVRLIGRGRVLNFLSGLLAKFIAKLVGPEQAPALSRAIVDAGLKFLNMEMSEAQRHGLAASAVAATVEETVNRVASLPDYVLENEELLEGFALEAFEQAAAANLPALFSDTVYRQRPDLLEGGINAGWILLPFRRGARRYKKCSRVFKVKITPQMAAEVQNFDDETLSDYFQDQLGLPEGEEVEAEVHLYETLPGTIPADIVRGESQTPGASSDLEDPAQLHLLTREAAGTLLGRPGLGRTPTRRATPQTPAAGQRLYRVAVPGRRIPMMLAKGGRRRMRRAAHINVTLDCVQDQLRVQVFLSEVKAQNLAVRMRQNAHHGALVTSFARLMAKRIPPRLQGKRPRRLKIVQAGIAAGPSFDAALKRMASAVPQAFIAKVEEWLVLGFSEFIKTQAQAFLTAVERPDDGVTLCFSIQNPPGLKEICNALAGKASSPEKVTAIVSSRGVPVVKVHVKAGHKCD